MQCLDYLRRWKYNHSTQLPAHVETSDAIIVDDHKGTIPPSTLQVETIAGAQSQKEPESKTQSGDPMKDAPLQDIYRCVQTGKAGRNVSNIFKQMNFEKRTMIQKNSTPELTGRYEY